MVESTELFPGMFILYRSLSVMRNEMQAFTLMELSIVLVILGLLAGGVMGGKSLLRASELRSIASEYNAYATATQSFENKYLGLPGDLKNATSFWGTAAPGAVCLVTDTPDLIATCNGNGDGHVDVSTTIGAGGTHTFENGRYWQHLINAGLLSGKQRALDLLYPGRIASWTSLYYGALTGSTHFFDGDYGNSITVNLVTISPQELAGIDGKIDDGKPATGKQVVYAVTNLSVCTDAASSSTLTANYLGTLTSSLDCYPVFRQAY